MKQLIWVAIAFSMVLTGAGCVKPAQTRNKNLPLMPTVDITSPRLSGTTADKSIKIMGKSNMDIVYIGQEQTLTKSGTFESTVELEEGVNYIQVSAGNGMTTTTKTIQIEKNNL